MTRSITIRGARQHNLRNITVELPHRAVTVITGPSGSGKSSLAFDTLYAEGQRRYVESLSVYARQFLERMPKPDVDAIEGIAPAIAIEQKNPTRTSRSTVGTATEVYDYLRLLWARVGRTACPTCGRELRPDTPGGVADALLAEVPGARALVTFPLHASEQVTHAVLVENLRAQGFVRVLVGGATVHLDALPPGLDLAAAADRLVVVDRLVVTAEGRGRLVEAVETAFRAGDGDAVVVLPDTGVRRAITERFECPNDGHRAPAPTPQLFSFNNPRGACPACNGFGATLEYDEALIVPFPDRTLRGGALDPWTKPRYDARRRQLAEFCRAERIPLDVPWRALPAAQRERLLRARTRGYTGIVPFLEALEAKRYKQYIRVFLRQYQTARPCGACGGTRLGPAALHVRVAGRTIAEVSALPIAALHDWLATLALPPADQAVADHILREARDRVRFLVEVGLGYLSLHRATRTLSGGEAQRIALASALGSRLVDTLYVLDEPTIGLHPRDVDRLLGLLTRLRDAGNTVVMVEHDLAAMRVADHLVELGPGSGDQGGRVVFTGPRERAAESPLTGRYLTGERRIPLRERPRPPGSRWLTLTGARANNLRGVDLHLPLGRLTVVTGPSGSGKSTLVHDVLYRALEQRLTGEHSARRHLGEQVGAYDDLRGYESLSAAVLMDQAPIGRTPRSNPVTYVKAFDPLRRLFAETPAARQRRLGPGAFSFNVPGGRCEVCEGAGAIEVEMQFMADVFVPCEACGGRRFGPRVLEVTVDGRTIADVLDLTVDQAIRAFPREEKLGQALWQVQQVGLGYLRLGQPATTLSGGEAQRLKIARELATAASRRGAKLYVLDEPTTGLHLEDVRTLIAVLDRLVDHGHTVVVIEHHVEVMKRADWIVDLGPGGGDDGGRVVAMGPVAEVSRVEGSATAPYLREALRSAPSALPA